MEVSQEVTQEGSQEGQILQVVVYQEAQVLQVVVLICLKAQVILVHPRGPMIPVKSG